MLLLLANTNETAVGVQAVDHPLGAQAMSVLPVGMGHAAEQLVHCALAPGVDAGQALANLLSQRDQGVAALQAVAGALTHGAGALQELAGDLAAGVARAQALDTALSAEPSGRVQVQAQELAAKDVARGLQGLLTPAAVDALRPAVAWDLLLDGVSIRNLVDDIHVRAGQDQVHNELTVRSRDDALFTMADPRSLSGQPRLKLQVGGRTLWFLLEARSGEASPFTLWGRSGSVRDDAPYAAVSSVEGQSLASAAAADLLATCSLDWSLDVDWVLPEEYAPTRSAVVEVAEMASQAGGVLRATDGGGLLVRQEYPVRPADLPTAPQDVAYDRELSLLRLDCVEHLAGGANAVLVRGAASHLPLPMLEVEQSTVAGDGAFVRAYWKGVRPDPAHVSAYVSTGRVEDLGEHQERVTETVRFEQGVAELGYPAKSLERVDWLGRSAGSVQLTAWSRELVLDDMDAASGGHGLARVRYRTGFRRYRLRGDGAETLLFVLHVTGADDVSVVTRLDDGRERRLAPDHLSAPLLTTGRAAVRAGAAWLYRNALRRRVLTVRAPFQDAARDGGVAFVQDETVQASGPFFITRADILISGPQVLNELELLQWQR